MSGFGLVQRSVKLTPNVDETDKCAFNFFVQPNAATVDITGREIIGGLLPIAGYIPGCRRAWQGSRPGDRTVSMDGG